MRQMIIAAIIGLVTMATLASGIEAAELATDTGFYIGMKYQDERFMPQVAEAQLMHITNVGPVVGFAYNPSVTKFELQGFYTQLEIPSAVMPGMSLKDEKLSGVGFEFSQGFQLVETGDVKVGGFVNYVYHFGDFGQSFVIPTEYGDYPIRIDIPRFHQLRTGGILQAKPFDFLTVHATGGYQLQGTFIGGGASVRLGSVDVGGEYFYGIKDKYNSYTVNAAIHF